MAEITKFLGEALKETLISVGVHKALEKKEGGHAAAPAPPAHDAGGHGDSHGKSHGSKRGKGKGGHGKGGDGHGGEAKHDTTHATPAAPAVSSAAAMGKDLARYVDKLLVDNRDLLFQTLRVTPPFDKANVLAHLDEASKGNARMMENKLVNLLVEAITFYEGDTWKLRADARKVIRHLNGLSPEAFWREMDILDHNPIEQHAKYVATELDKAMEKLTKKKIFGIRIAPKTKKCKSTGGTP